MDAAEMQEQIVQAIQRAAREMGAVQTAHGSDMGDHYVGWRKGLVEAAWIARSVEVTS